jgi:hypothetical protein
MDNARRDIAHAAVTLSGLNVPLTSVFPAVYRKLR